MNLKLIQPRHIYADKKEDGDRKLTAPLFIAGTRIKQSIMASGEDMVLSIQDENFGPESEDVLDSDVVGINLIGAPYIPKVIEMIRNRVSQTTNILLGGQIINSLSSEEFERLFCRLGNGNVFNGNDDSVLCQVLGLEENSLPDAFDVSQVDLWEELPKDHLGQYLNEEIMLFVSQGCKYNCSFCQATKSQIEKYRSFDALKEELSFLVQKCEKFGIPKLKMYVSNLDLFQSPRELEKFADLLLEFDFPVEFRGLATIESFLALHEKSPELLRKLKNVGLTSVGYGVDGATAEVWESIGKRHNFLEKEGSEQEQAISAIGITKEEYGIIPEMLMVFGHLSENDHSLRLAYEFCKKMHKAYGAIPRPHVAKSIIPGTKNWQKPENKKLIEKFIQNPEFFQALDYTALASGLSHEDEQLKILTNKYYQMICDIPSCDTPAVIPNTPEFQELAKKEGVTVEEQNRGKFDR